MAGGLLPAGSSPELQKKLGEMTRGLQSREHTAFDREPFANEIPEGGVVFARISGTTYLYSKLNGVRCRVAMTDRP